MGSELLYGFKIAHAGTSTALDLLAAIGTSCRTAQPCKAACRERPRDYHLSLEVQSKPRGRLLEQ